MASPLTRTGRPNKRNLDKKWRQPNPNLPMDMMKGYAFDSKGGIKSYMINTTGCYGFRSQVKSGAPPHVIEVGTAGSKNPKRGKTFNRKKKLSGGIAAMVGKNEHVIAARILRNHRINIWNQLINQMVLDKITPRQINYLDVLDQTLLIEMEHDEYWKLRAKADERKKAMLGMVKCGKLTPKEKIINLKGLRLDWEIMAD